MGRNVDELQEEYRTELLKFLIQKINHAGGSLQFQHLSGLFQQLRFEIKDTFGATKSAVMKFLKANPNTFKVNTKGVVTVVNSTLDSNCPADEANQTDIAKKISVSKIKNGEGYIFKIFPQYAIIKTIHPIYTYVFFTPPEYGAGKHSLFVDLDLNVGDKVGFNANHGHIDYEIEYRATKVWRIYEREEENAYPENVERNKIKKTNKIKKPENFTGKGVIKKLFSNVGFISVLGEGNEKNLFFYQENCKDRDIRCGDKVEFVAEYISNEWQATEITKKKNMPSDHAETCINKQSIKGTDMHNFEESIKNEPGRIFPHSKGAILKFGKNFSEIADGTACNFYLYGIRVAYPDLAMEFSEGDYIRFDAVKSEDSHGWKAVLVWKGEKPATIPDKKSKENFGSTKSVNKIDHDDHSSEVSESRRKRNFKNSKDVNVFGRESESNRNKAMLDWPPRRKFNSTPVNYHKDNVVSSKMMPHKGTKNALDKHKKKCNKNFNDEYNQRTSFSKSKLDKVENNSENWLTSKDSYFDASKFSDLDDSSEVASEENNELQDSLYSTRKFLKEDNQPFIGTSDLKEESFSESESENEKSLARGKFLEEDNQQFIGTSDLKEESFSESESENEKGCLVRGKSSIKKFDAIDGEVINLHCKVGFIKSDLLIKDVDFILNAFYLNGNSVEEQQVTDLKEVIKVGDIVKFNCFEIIDDEGEIHQKVTMAWKGCKPNVYEMKPEEFIKENDLSVSSEQDYKSKSARRFDTSTGITFDEASEFKLEAGSSLNDKFDDTPQENSGTSTSRLDDVDEHGSSDHETLPDVVLRKLETCGFISSNLEDALNVAQEIIELVLKNSGINANQNCSLQSDSATLCSACQKTKKSVIGKRTTVDAEVQTIVTGEVVATRNGQPNQKRPKKNQIFIN